jgi:hypothetical protein
LFGATWNQCRRKVAISVSLRIFAANIPTIRACVAGGGWRGYPLTVIRKELGVTWLDASLLRAAAPRTDKK